ncbi:MAG TPA: hypothetical protein VFR92_07805 [Sphingomicrobium sp.]|nr:hypothetical protein [Sphingomicrobium sp.]
MKHQKIEDSARVWMVTLGPDGKLQEQLDPQFVAALGNGESAREVADLLATAAGEAEVAESRLW